jgi:ABC-type dipeptide/oligopeptide/nickel transport system permease subunit
MASAEGSAGSLAFAETGRRRRNAGRMLRRYPRLGVFGGVLVVLILIAVLAPFISPGHPTQTAPRERSLGPSWEHPLGTDPLGRDNLTRVFYGARVSLAVGLIAVLIGSSIGVTVGVIAGYAGGWVDMAISRLLDALLAFPGLIFLVAVAAALGPSLRNSMIAIGVLAVPAYARLARGQVLQAREFEYVTAARVVGAGEGRVVVRHILPNIVSPLIVQATLASGAAILAEATLSFLGLGAQPPTPDWGSMIFVASSYLRQNPWFAVGPGVAIFLTVFSFNMFGDALRDALDPRLRRSA